MAASPAEPGELSSWLSSLDSDAARPLIVFVDELDRCRPTYAIELLENAKHPFSVPGVVFVLSLHKRQLIHAICAVYGSEFDADGYLRRFVDMDYILPAPEPGNYTEYLFDRLGLNAHLDGRKRRNSREEHGTLKGLTKDLIGLVRFSLREQMQCISPLLITINTIPDHHSLFPIVLVTMTVLREWNPALFSRFESGVARHMEVIEALRELPGGGEFLSSHHGLLVQTALAWGEDELAESDNAHEYYRTLAGNESADELDIKRAEAIIRATENLAHVDGERGMTRTLKRISLSQSFIPHQAESGDV